jgi:Flp pilus assembly protein TadD
MMNIGSKKKKRKLSAAIQQGRKLLAARKEQEAFAFLDEAVQRFPENGEIRLLYASVLLVIRPDDVAVEAAKAVELDPEEPAILLRAAHLMLNRGELETARAYAARANELARPDFVLMGGLENLNGLLAYFDGNYALAEEKLRSAFSMEPASRNFAKELAVFLAERGRLAEAVSILDEALEHVKDVRDRTDLGRMREQMADEVGNV